MMTLAADRKTGHRVTPSREEMHDYFQQGDLVPVYRTLLADLETPVSVYLKLAQQGVASFLLESVEGGDQIGRYSFLGVDPRSTLIIDGDQITEITNGESETRTLREGEDPLDVIKSEISRVTPVRLEGLPRFVGGAVGYISYDIVRHFETIPATASTDLSTPDVVFLLVDTLVMFDHAKHQLVILSNARNEGDPDAAYDAAIARIDAITDALVQPFKLPPLASPMEGEELASNVSRETFEDNVLKAKEYIAAGDAFQIVISQRFSRKTSADPLSIYRALRVLNPSPYMFFFEFGDKVSGDSLSGERFSLIGASPETMVRLEDGVASVRPIAGTRKRGKTEAEDLKLEEDLLADPKELAEHVMLIDLGRNDLGRVCEYGSVKVSNMMNIERYSHVMHIVSQVEGKVRPDIDAFDLFRATFPAGTLSGAPKIRAMEIIEELEGTRRGTYGGAVGYFSYDGSMDTCITIRAMVMQGDTVHVQAGSGIVTDSDPAYEYEESVNKARAVEVAIRQAEEGLQ